MRDYVKEIVDILQEDNKVILFSVGGDTLNILRALKQRFNILPTALCDNDINKQGGTFKGLYGMKIYSPQKAYDHNPDAYWFVSSLDYKFEIIGELLHKYKVSKEKIINYEPVVWKKSCSYLEKSIVCDEYRRFSYCWYQPQTLNPIPFDGQYENSLSDFVKLRDNTIDCYNNQCQDCHIYCEGYYPKDRKIRWINYGIGGVCNFDCMYCRSNARHAKKIDDQAPKLPALIQHLKDMNLLADDYGINVAPGEPTVHPEKDSIFDSLDCYSNVINTNLYVYNEKLYKLTADKFTKLVVSIDSGTKETFKKVKGVDAFEQVCNNLKRFSNAGYGIIVLKYVFIPNVNDNEVDIEGFVNVCKNTGCLIGNISYDYGSPLPIPETTLQAMKKTKKELLRNNILCTSNIVYSSSSYIDELKKINS